MNLFKKKSYIKIETNTNIKNDEENIDSPSIPNGLWIKCKYCKKTIYNKEIGQYKICPNCGGHFRMNAIDRIGIIADENTFEEIDSNMSAKNPMSYPDYDLIIKKAQEKSGIKDGVITGICKINGIKVAIAVMDSNFMMGSMGSVVGEKITRAVEKATNLKIPIIIFTTSGGARMQEGIISLMQMAKVSAALSKHNNEGLLYITVLTDPTTGGVSASFGMLGDIILSEPKALIGFAGQRVIEGTINEKLPEGFQTAEFQLEHGFVDKIVSRDKLKYTIGKILKIHCYKGDSC